MVLSSNLTVHGLYLNDLYITLLTKSRFIYRGCLGDFDIVTFMVQSFLQILISTKMQVMFVTGDAIENIEIKSLLKAT